MFLKILQIKGEKKLREVVTISEKYLFVSYKESYSLAKPVRFAKPVCVTYTVGKCVTLKMLAVAHGKGDSLVRASKETERVIKFTMFLYSTMLLPRGFPELM